MTDKQAKIIGDRIGQEIAASLQTIFYDNVTFYDKLPVFIEILGKAIGRGIAVKGGKNV